MASLEALRDHLTRPTPRSGGEDLLGAPRERLRASRKFFLVFGGAWMLFCAVIGVAAGWPDCILDRLAFGPPLLGGMLAFILLPTYLYLRQDLTLSRQLLREGTMHDAEIVALTRGPRLETRVGVRWTGDGAANTETFRVFPTDEQRAALGKDAVVLTHAGSAAVFLRGLGLVATR